MREPRRCSSPSIFHPSTNRRMYRFASNGEIGEPCGMPRVGGFTLTCDISQLPGPRNWAIAGGSNGYRAAPVRRQLTPGLISSLPGTAGLPPFIFFSTSYPELDSAVRHPMRRIGNDGTTISRSPKQSCSWFGGCGSLPERKHETLRSIDARS